MVNMEDNRKRCGAKTKNGGTCKSWGMENGRCRMHGGTNPGRPIIHGRYSVKHRASLNEKMQQFLADPAPANLMPELAIQRAFLEEFLDKVTSGPISAKTADHVFAMTESIGRLVERITRMLNQTAITQMDIHYLQTILTDLIMKYIDDPDKRFEFLAELRSAFGSDHRANRTAALAAPAEQSIE
jgi:hypothetical protein